MTPRRLQKIVTTFPKIRIAVVGDLMLDVYIWGKASRISPEAPVPVVQVKEKTSCPGGAANVMRNVVTLGGKSAAFGVIGDDVDGIELKKLLEGYKIPTGTLAVDCSRRTTNKQRIIASAQQLMRVDFEDVGAVAENVRENITGQIAKLIENKEIDAVIFEDYGKGLLCETMLQRIVDVARKHDVITTLDPKPGHLMRVTGLTVIKPNRPEAYAMAGMFQKANGIPIEQDRELGAVAAQLMTDWQPEHLLISLSEHGMALFHKDNGPVIIPTRAREVYDVSGAGDTVISAFTLALAAGASPREAAEIANHAAGIVVGKVGTVTVSAEDLIKSFYRED